MKEKAALQKMLRKNLSSILSQQQLLNKFYFKGANIIQY